MHKVKIWIAMKNIFKEHRRDGSFLDLLFPFCENGSIAVHTRANWFQVSLNAFFQLKHSNTWILLHAYV